MVVACILVGLLLVIVFCSVDVFGLYLSLWGAVFFACIYFLLELCE